MEGYLGGIQNHSIRSATIILLIDVMMTLCSFLLLRNRHPSPEIPDTWARS